MQKGCKASAATYFIDVDSDLLLDLTYGLGLLAELEVKSNGLLLINTLQVEVVVDESGFADSFITNENEGLVRFDE